MRRIALILAIFCAVLSGWTPVMGQLQGLHAPSSLHDGGHGHAGNQCPDRGCKPAKMVHPTLCAACFAVASAASLIDRVEIPGGHPRPMVDLPLMALTLQPRAPPPRDLLAI